MEQLLHGAALLCHPQHPLAKISLAPEKFLSQSCNNQRCLVDLIVMRSDASTLAAMNILLLPERVLFNRDSQVNLDSGAEADNKRFSGGGRRNASLLHSVVAGFTTERRGFTISKYASPLP